MAGLNVPAILELPSAESASRSAVGRVLRSALAPGAGSADNSPMFFTPKWKKEAEMLVKGARKFLHYKRDLLKPDRIAEIESRRSDLIAAVKAKDLSAVAEASKQLRATCENVLPRETPQTGFQENVEVAFVAIVIALGLRAYYLQPFRIPTGSMQPTLNGIVGTPTPEAEWPSWPVRMAQKVLRGRTYVNVVMEEDRKVATDARGNPLIGDIQFLKYLSRSEIRFEDSRPGVFSWFFGTDPLRLPAPVGPMQEIGLVNALRIAAANGGVIPKGTVIAEGTVDSGDLVLVDKFSYHFRKPRRGETFVFDTIGIRGIHERSGDQAAGSHYIKRLVGVPGDTLSIDEPYLMVNGKIASESTIQRVTEGGPPFPAGHPGYTVARPERPPANGRPLPQYLDRAGRTMFLRDKAPVGMREYVAIGDNTTNSLDSRYWGTVKEFNLVGPALFSLWPITTGHWGFIR
jgi:signal peptidase I